MKVLLLNGSPHETGCTYTALKEVSDELERCGVETEIFHIKQPPDGLPWAANGAGSWANAFLRRTWSIL